MRSPIAHARIVKIDTSAALESDGCVAVFTAEELDDPVSQRPPLPVYAEAFGQPLLATDVVRFVGESVAAVLTDERYQGEDAAELVDVEYEPLPAVVDPKAALSRRDRAVRRGRDERVLRRASRGAQEDIFADCEAVISHEILNQRVAVAPLEVRAAAAVWGDDEPAHRVDP